ncbi:MAG: hypothetical protein H7287_10615 [Thermoleophilia bacterium]|nr:hypothetical protein [Thermoleophilia bacterium]
MTTAIGSISAATQIVVGGRGALDAVRSIAAHPGERLLLDGFRLSDMPLVDTLRTAARHAQVRVLADHGSHAAQSRDLLEPAGVEFTSYGAAPLVNHGKGIVGERGAISTAAFMGQSADRFDLTALLDAGDSAMLRAVLEASLAGDSARVRSLAPAAALHGIVFNDPRAGVTTLTSATDGLLGSARERLHIATKEVSDAMSLDLLVGRGYDDVDTVVATRTLAKASRRDLKHAGVKLHRLDIANGSLHGNMIVSDDRAYVGSAYLREFPLNRAGSTVRRREVGFVTRDPTTVDAVTRAIHDRVARG